MIRHIVLTKFKPDVAEEQVTEVYDGLHQLTARLPGAGNFIAGRSKSPEQIERGYMHGFTIDFDDWADLKIYADHPEHKNLGAKLTSMAVGGLEGVLVLDLEYESIMVQQEPS